MVQRKPTPEEQLLKLIEGSQPGASGKPPAGSPAAKPSAAGKKSPLAPAAFFGRLPGFIEYCAGVFSKKSGKSVRAVPVLALNLKTANQFVLALVIASAGYLLVDLFFLKPGSDDFLSQVSVSEPVYPIYEQIAGDAPKELSYYQDALRRRNPFLAPRFAAPLDAENPDTSSAALPPSSPVQEVLQNFKLVGISMGEEPLAMIEEVPTGRTFFLRAGQEIRGVKVQSVSKEKVVVSYEGQEGELF